MTNPKPHILLVSHASGLCGAERSLLDLVAGLNGWRCTVIVPSEGPLTQALADKNIPYIVTRYHAWTGREKKAIRAVYRMLCNVWQALKLSWKLSDQHIDLVYVNTTSTPFGALLSRYLKVPCVWHVREWMEGFDFGVQKSLKFVETQSACVITNSHAMKQKLSGLIAEKKMEVVHNGPITWPQPDEHALAEKTLPQQQALSLCVVATVYKNKGIEDAIEVLPLLSRQGINAALAIVGEGSSEYIQILKEKSDGLGVAEKISWHGFVNQPLEIIQSSDICLICSRQEAFGRVAVEAMSVATPVISTAVGGLVEIIQDKETGLLYSPGDIEGLAQQIANLTGNLGEYQKIQHQAMEYAFEYFTVEQYQKKMIAIFHQVVG